MSDTTQKVTANDDTGGHASRAAGPDQLRCVWPGCTRQRAAGRAAGSGRQKEYCLQADPPESGGGPVHNARNRWASLRGAAMRATRNPPGDDADAHGGADADVDQRGTGTGGGQPAGTVRDRIVFSAAKERASDLLEQARRQHSAAIGSLQAERELYQRLAEQLAALADPASLDLEIAAIASRAGASVAQAEEDAARARHAQLAAEGERDDAVRLRAHADAAAEQLTADAEAAELALAERTAEFDLDRAAFVARAREAEEAADRSRAEAAEARAAAEAAETRAAAQTASAQARAKEAIARARRDAEDEVAVARRDAAEQVTAALDRAREQVEAAQARADAQAAQARRDVEAARRELVTTIADASAAIDRARAEAAAAGNASADAQASAATAIARSVAIAAQAERLQAEIERLRSEHAAELARLDAAHQTALDAQRARANRAEDELDAVRVAGRRTSLA